LAVCPSRFSGDGGHDSPSGGDELIAVLTAMAGDRESLLFSLRRDAALGKRFLPDLLEHDVSFGAGNTASCDAAARIEMPMEHAHVDTCVTQAGGRGNVHNFIRHPGDPARQQLHCENPRRYSNL
jgi:hypothetical protein